MTDEAKFIRRLKRRDEQAFTEMVRDYQDRVFAIVYRMVGDRAEAEDVAQEVFVTVFKSIDSFRGESKFSTWLFRIATNHTKNRLKYLARRHHKKKSSIDDEYEREMKTPLSEISPRPDRLAEGAEMERVIKEALAALDEDQRAILVFRDIEQLSYAEIADILGVREGTVKSRLFRARAALQQKINERYRR